MELTEGIIVKSIDYRDTDKIIYLISDSGKMSLILKGAKKSSSKTFNYSHELSKISFGSSQNYLTTGNVISSYVNIKNNIKSLRSALIISEISYSLIDHINDHLTFYKFLCEILDLLNTGINNEILEIIFRVKVLYLLGVAPVFNKCVDCNTKEDLVGFSFYDGGMKCALHNTNIDYLYNDDVISQLSSLYLQKLDKIDTNQSIKYQSLDSFLNRYYDNYLGFKSKVNEVFSKL